MTVKEDLLLEGPFFNQQRASKVAIQPTGQSALVTLGAVAAAAGTSARNASGLPTLGLPLPLTEALTVAGVHLTASAGSGAFGITMTPGTTLCLASEIANASTVTDTVLFEAVLPQSYVAGQNITLSVDAQTTLAASGTLTTETLALDAFLDSATGGEGSSLITSGNTITLSAVATVETAVIQGATLKPGSHLVLRGVVKMIETGTHAAQTFINSVALS